MTFSSALYFCEGSAFLVHVNPLLLWRGGAQQGDAEEPWMCMWQYVSSAGCILTISYLMLSTADIGGGWRREYVIIFVRYLEHVRGRLKSSDSTPPAASYGFPLKQCKVWNRAISAGLVRLASPKPFASLSQSFSCFNSRMFGSGLKDAWNKSCTFSI